jgi:hypothetical protein
VLQISGDRGFATCWGGKATAASDWHPDYPDVMNIAKSALGGAADLFPQYGGMPGLQRGPAGTRGTRPAAGRCTGPA